ncbi:MAG TPA: substrate-binding domain-containing protein [Steroidobacteraceae bacterium]|nr:substrate-binding domain-containing protein [Steroidobacteraceae bacterium]
MLHLSLRRSIRLASLLFAAGAWLPSHAQEHPYITVATTMSTQQSGLLAFVAPVFAKRTGIEVYAVAMSSREAFRSAETGECDVVIADDRSRELQFMQNGSGRVLRYVFHDDFVLVGPENDPAKIEGTHDALAALRKIVKAKALFVSSGDMSDTEQRLWAEAGEPPTSDHGQWYVETGSGSERTLATAASMHGYVLTNRRTWILFNDHGGLKVDVEGDPRMIDQYAAILVKSAQHPQVKADLGMAFIDWLTSPEGQTMIANYKVNGVQLYIPDPAKR